MTSDEHNQYVLSFFKDSIKVSRVDKSGKTLLYIIRPPSTDDARITTALSYLLTAPASGKHLGTIVYDPLRATIDAYSEESATPQSHADLRNGQAFLVGYTPCTLRSPSPNSIPHAKQFSQHGLDEIVEVYAHNMGPSTIEFYSAPDRIRNADPKAPTNVAVIYTKAESVLHLLPLALKRRAIADGATKTIERVEYSVPSPAIIIKKENPNKDSKFAKKVLENYPPLHVTDAFPYIPQDDEQERFRAYMRDGTDSIVLDGPTGNGKSTLVRDHLSTTKQPVFYIAGRETLTYDKLVAVDRVNHDNTCRTSPGPLLLSFIWDVPLYLEEGARIPAETWGDIREVLEQNRIFVDSEFGPEYIYPGKNWRMIVTGNFSPRYTSNRLDDAIWQRMSIIDIPAPDREHMYEVLGARADEYGGVISEDHVRLLADINNDIMQEAQGYADLGLKGAARIIKLMGKTKGDILRRVSLESLIMDNIVSPVTKSNYSKGIKENLLGIVHRHLKHTR